ncbi:MAG: hypothetical protein ACK58T_36050, partial [Phycisphaerae bacterium]
KRMPTGRYVVLQEMSEFSDTSFASFVIFVVKSRLHHEGLEDHEAEAIRKGEALPHRAETCVVL